MNCKKFILIAAMTALVAGAMAQGGGGQRRGGFGPPDGLSLTGRDDVQKDLNLTDDEKAKLSDLRDKSQQKMRDAMTEARDSAGDDRDAMMKAMTAVREKLSADNDKDVAGILTPDQTKRLKEIKIQFVGVAIVASDKGVQKDLNITDDQIAKFKDLQTRQRQAMMEAFQNAQGDQQAMRDIMQKNQKAMADEINKILTDDQKAKFKDMGGTKKFDRQDPPPGGGR